MASKERGGLSKREYAAKMGGTVKSSSNSSSSSTLKAPKAPKIKEFKFDSSKLLPQYQQEAASLYAPQLQQLSQLREITKGQAEEAKVRTNADFARLLEREKESINQRGAFFGGGAVDRENRIGAEQGYALRGIEQQAQLQNLDYDTTQGNIGQAQKDYVAGKVEGAFSSAYQSFRDKVSDAMSKYQMELGQYNADRDYQFSREQFDRQNMESDRQYALSAAASGRAGASVAQSKAQAQVLADAQGNILGSRGTDGKADPGVYAEQKAAYIRAGGSPTDFDAAYGGTLSRDEQGRLSVMYGTPQSAAEIKAEADAATAKAKTVKEAEAVKIAMQEKLDKLNKVTGRGVGSGFTGAVERNTYIPFNSPADNLNTVASIVGKETLDSLLALKERGGTLGAVSEKELAILQASGSVIGAAAITDEDTGKITGYNMSEKQFFEEVDRMKAAAERMKKAAEEYDVNNDPLGINI